MLLKIRLNPTISWLSFFIVIALVSGCSQNLPIARNPPITLKATDLEIESEDNSWWQLRFKLIWPEGETVDLSYHTLIADQILAPIIGEHDATIGLWRFHRRAARDDADHQFSFIFYTDKLTAAAINKQTFDNPLIESLKQGGLLETVRFNSIESESLWQLENTSDKNWPLAIQRSWPYFIMGVSQTWLMLVQEISAQRAISNDVTFDELLSHYKAVSDQLSSDWQDYGQHAYLHHLNAIFGYKPLKINTLRFESF